MRVTTYESVDHMGCNCIGYCQTFKSIYNNIQESLYLQCDHFHFYKYPTNPTDIILIEFSF